MIKNTVIAIVKIRFAHNVEQIAVPNRSQIKLPYKKRGYFSTIFGTVRVGEISPELPLSLRYDICKSSSNVTCVRRCKLRHLIFHQSNFQGTPVYSERL